MRNQALFLIVALVGWAQGQGLSASAEELVTIRRDMIKVGFNHPTWTLHPAPREWAPGVSWREDFWGTLSLTANDGKDTSIYLNQGLYGPGIAELHLLVEGPDRNALGPGDLQFYAVQSRNNPGFQCTRDYTARWPTKIGN